MSDTSPAVKPAKPSFFFSLVLYALFFTPLIVDFKSSDIYFLSKALYIKLLVVFLVAGWIFQISQRQEQLILISSPLTLPLGLFFLLHLVSWLSALNIYEAAKYTAAIFYFFLLYLAILNNWENQTEIRRSLLVIFGVGSAVALYGLLQYQGIDLVVLEAGAEPVSTLGNVNFSAQYLVMLSPMILFFFFWENNWGIRLSLGLAWGVINTHILLTYSRGGWVGLFISFIFLFVLVVYLKRKAWRITRLKVGLTSLVFVLALGGFLLTRFGRKRVLPQIKSIVNPTHGANLGRLLIWRSTLKIIRDFPWGVGAENYKLIYPKYRDQREWSLSGRNSRLERAHNDYLQIAAELGVVGLGVFLWLVGSVFQRGLKIIFHPQLDESLKVLAGALLCGLTATLGHAVFSFPLRNPASTLTFYILLSLIAVLNNIAFPAAVREWRFSLSEPPSHYYYALAGIAALLLLLMVIGFRTIVLPFVADRVYQTGRLKEMRKKWDEAETAYRKAVEISPRNYDFLIHLGNTLSRGGKQTEAIQIYQRYLVLDPFHRNTYNNLGNAYEANKEYQKAIDTYKEAIELDSLAVPAHLNLGNVYLKTNRLDEAIAAYKKAIEIDDKYPGVHHNIGDAYNAKGEYAKSNVEYLKAARNVAKRPLIYQNMGYNYFQLQEYDKAIEYLEKVFGLSEDPKVLQQNYKYLGNIYFQKGKEANNDIKLLEEALSAWRKTNQLNPADEVIRKNIVELSRLIDGLKASR